MPSRRGRLPSAAPFLCIHWPGSSAVVEGQAAVVDVSSRVKAVAEWFDLAPRHGPCQKMHLSETELNLVPAAAQPKTSVVMEVSSSR